jgi:peptide/nickel transport system permease protein
LKASKIGGILSLSYIVGLSIVSLLAYVLVPDSSPNANQMHLSIHSQPPGFKTQMLRIPIEDTPSQGSFFWGTPSRYEEIPIQAWRFQGDALEIQVYGTVDGFFRPVNTNRFPEPLTLRSIEKKWIVEQSFPLGTDKYGRDLLSRLLIGSRISLSIGLVAVIISLLIGVVLGGIAGYYRGTLDLIIMWLINVVWSIPTLLMVIGISLVLGRGFWQVFIAVGLSMWVEIARLVRGQVISVKEKTYIEAAHALGFSHFRILFFHILPVVVGPLIVMASANFASAILIESGLSFLGIGAQPPVPSWGGMVKEHFRYLLLGKPYLALIPGFAIMSLVLTFMTLGNALQDYLDVKH